MSQVPPAEVIAGTLEAAYWRVTGTDSAEKIRHREHLRDLRNRVFLAYSQEKRPTAAILREAIGDTDDKSVLAALDRWAEAEHADS